MWAASCNGALEVIEWLVASGKDLGDLNKKGEEAEDEGKYTALEIAREGKDGSGGAAGGIHGQSNADTSSNSNEAGGCWMSWLRRSLLDSFLV